MWPSSSAWHEASISSAIPKPIVDPRKQGPSASTTPIIPMSPSPSYYSPEKPEATAEGWACHTFEWVVVALQSPGAWRLHGHDHPFQCVAGPPLSRRLRLFGRVIAWRRRHGDDRGRTGAWALLSWVHDGLWDSARNRRFVPGA